MQIGILEAALARGPEMLKARQRLLVIAQHQWLAHLVGRDFLLATHQRCQIVFIVEYHARAIAPVAAMGSGEGAGQRFFQWQHGKARGPQARQGVAVAPFGVAAHGLLQQRQGLVELALAGMAQAHDHCHQVVVRVACTHQIQVIVRRLGRHGFLRQQVAHVLVFLGHGQNQRPGVGVRGIGANCCSASW